MQTLVQLLPPVEIGTTQLKVPMRPLVFCLVATAMAFGTHIGIQKHVEWINQATAKQCLNQDWPAHQEADHIAWCEDNGYVVIR